VIILQEKVSNVDNKLNVSQAALALISTIVGGAIVGLPNAFYYVGLPIGTACIILIAI